MGADKATHLHINNHLADINSVTVLISDVVNIMNKAGKPGELTIDKCIEYLSENASEFNIKQYTGLRILQDIVAGNKYVIQSVKL